MLSGIFLVNSTVNKEMSVRMALTPPRALATRSWGMASSQFTRGRQFLTSRGAWRSRRAGYDPFVM